MQKYLIIEAANERQFTLTVQGEKQKGKLSGSKLKFPIVTSDKNINVEISWNLAERLATGAATNVIY